MFSQSGETPAAVMTQNRVVYAPSHLYLEQFQLFVCLPELFLVETLKIQFLFLRAS